MSNNNPKRQNYNSTSDKTTREVRFRIVLRSRRPPIRDIIKTILTACSGYLQNIRASVRFYFKQ